MIDTPRGVGYQIYNRITTDLVIYHVAARAFPKDVMASENESEYTLELKTNDGQNIKVDLTILYSLSPNEVPELHQAVGPTYESQIILPQLRSEARIAIGSYTAEEIYSGKVRDAIQKGIAERLQKSVSKYPAIQIQDALIRQFEFSKDFERAIEQKKLAAQQVEINKNRALAEEEEEEAKRQEAEARGAKLKAIQAAEGRAQAVKIEADAERYKLEQEAAGKLANYKADAEGKKLQAEALGGGQNLVALKFAENIPDKFRVFAVPVGQNSTSIMDLNGILKGMFNNTDNN